MTLEMNFSIYDMQWVLPMKQRTFKFTQEETQKILTGEQSIEFEIDYNMLLKEESFDEIFNNDKYPKMKKGDLSFFEIAESYQNLIRSQGMTQEEIAKKQSKG